MKKILLTLVTLSLCHFVTCGHAASEWLPGFEDVPMMENTYVIQGAGFSYSQPDGKIVVEDISSDSVTRRQFQRFFSDALRELGWKLESNRRAGQKYTRDSDVLTIEILSENPLKARFSLMPAK
ncbi:MAG: hypothetical protein LBR41_03020 [Rickettsiales bacterium]|jgi:hypothetical protein|nr:hypothetical protein [Rickettsiales bacterium]